MKKPRNPRRGKLAKAQSKVRSEASDVRDLAALRRRITNLVCAEAMPMVETTIEQVQSGHYQALKYLFELVGLYPATNPDEDSQEDPLAKMLLRHLGVSATEFDPNSDAVK